MAGGWTPAVHLFTQSGGKLKFDEDNKIFFKQSSRTKYVNKNSFLNFLCYINLILNA